MNLMKGISETGIKESLQSINIGDCGVTKKEILSFLNDLGMENVTV